MLCTVVWQRRWLTTRPTRPRARASCFGYGRPRAPVGVHVRPQQMSRRRQAIASEVRTRIQRLSALSDAELRSLPEVQTERVPSLGNRVTFTTYRDIQKDQSLLIVVQAYQYLFLGIGNMFVEGIVVSPSGERSTAPENLLWDYS